MLKLPQNMENPKALLQPLMRVAIGEILDCYILSGNIKNKTKKFGILFFENVVSTIPGETGSTETIDTFWEIVCALQAAPGSKRVKNSQFFKNAMPLTRWRIH